MTVALPSVTAEVVAEAVDGLTSRLRNRLDAAIAALTATPVAAAGQSVVLACGPDAQVALTPDASGVIAEAAQVTCTCLLAPRCLHRAVALSLCPIAELPSPAGDGADGVGGVDGVGGTASVDGTAGVEGAVGVGGTAGVSVDAVDPPAEPGPAVDEAVPVSLTAAQKAAATVLWEAAAALLALGIAGAGAVPQAAMLRAAHTARVAGLPRCEAAALRVVRGIRAAREHDDSHHTSTLVAAFRELLLTSRLLADGRADTALVGTARRDYRPGGLLRVAGVCREPILTATGYGGIVTHLIGDDGRWYSLADVRPGGVGRARAAATASVAMAGAAINHRDLAVAGLSIAHASVSPEGRLGSGRSVRAAPTTVDAWASGSLVAVLTRPWSQTLQEQLPVDADPDLVEQFENRLVGGEVEIIGPDGEGLLVREIRHEPGTLGRVLRLLPALGHGDLAFVTNLRLIATRPGLRIRILGRLDSGTLPTVRPLAVGAIPGDDATLQLPPPWRGHADLGYDYIPASALPPPREPLDPQVSTQHTAPTGTDDERDAPSWRVSHLVDLAVVGGRRTVGEPARLDQARVFCAPLRRGGLPHGANLMELLLAEAGRRSRDVFGVSVDANPSGYAATWLALAMYAAGLHRATTDAANKEEAEEEAST